MRRGKLYRYFTIEKQTRTTALELVLLLEYSLFGIIELQQQWKESDTVHICKGTDKTD
jgi:hypothetical protein